MFILFIILWSIFLSISSFTYSWKYSLIVILAIIIKIFLNSMITANHWYIVCPQFLTLKWGYRLNTSNPYSLLINIIIYEILLIRPKIGIISLMNLSIIRVIESILIVNSAIWYISNISDICYSIRTFLVHTASWSLRIFRIIFFKLPEGINCLFFTIIRPTDMSK